MGFGLAVYIQMGTDLYLQLPFPHHCCALTLHRLQVFSPVDAVTCEGHLCEEIQKVCPSSVNLTLADWHVWFHREVLFGKYMSCTGTKEKPETKTCSLGVGNKYYK